MHSKALKMFSKKHVLVNHIIQMITKNDLLKNSIPIKLAFETSQTKSNMIFYDHNVLHYIQL